MSNFDAGELAEDTFRIFRQFLNLEELLQDAYDQGVADTIESMPGGSEFTL